MKILDLVQDSLEWHIWRQKVIGASDMEIIMNNSPYKTCDELFQEKKQQYPTISDDNAYIKRIGKEHEVNVRAWFNHARNVNYVPTCVVSDCGKYGASLDGYQDGKGIEIKYCGAEQITKLRNGDCKKWYYQLQSQIFVGELTDLRLLAGNKTDIVVCKIERNDDVITELQAHADHFIELLRGTRMPKYREFQDEAYKQVLMRLDILNHKRNEVGRKGADEYCLSEAAESRGDMVASSKHLKEFSDAARRLQNINKVISDILSTLPKDFDKLLTALSKNVPQGRSQNIA